MKIGKWGTNQVTPQKKFKRPQETFRVLTVGVMDAGLLDEDVEERVKGWPTYRQMWEALPRNKRIQLADDLGDKLFDYDSFYSYFEELLTEAWREEQKNV